MSKVTISISHLTARKCGLLEYSYKSLSALQLSSILFHKTCRLPTLGWPSLILLQSNPSLSSIFLLFDGKQIRNNECTSTVERIFYNDFRFELEYFYGFNNSYIYTVIQYQYSSSRDTKDYLGLTTKNCKDNNWSLKARRSSSIQNN